MQAEATCDVTASSDSTPFLLLREVIVVARYSLMQAVRHRSWALNTSLTPFFLMAPLVFIAYSFLGSVGPARQAFVELTGYDNYIGYVLVPLLDAAMTSTVYSNIGQALRQEQLTGTLERMLMSLRFPISLMLGRSLGFFVFVVWFATSEIILATVFFGLHLRVNPVSAVVLLALHLFLVYGTAFLMTSLFLLISDAFAVQMLFSRFLLLTLTGATYPITLLPGWLQVVARLIPFTWLYELERAAFLRATPLSELQPGLFVLTGMVIGLWVLAVTLFHSLLTHARRTGKLGMY
jgi:ABC-2 type transport system permease protein